MHRLQEIDDRGGRRPCRLTFANMKTVAKHSIILNDHKTSISLENEFWQGLREIAEQEGTSTGELVAKIDRERKPAFCAQLPSRFASRPRELCR
jgi:predicted DNA-binding ribbon-helix-helix protein